jgi:hypothetical protein
MFSSCKEKQLEEDKVATYCGQRASGKILIRGLGFKM